MPAVPSAFALMSALAIAAAAPTADTQDTRELLRRQTQELVDAIGSGSAAVWDRYLDAGVIYVDEGGRLLTKKQMVEQTRPLPEGVAGSIRVIDFDAAVHGDVAVASYIDDENEDYHGHKLHCQYRTTETWKRTPEGWRMIAGQVLALRTDPPAITLAPRQRHEYCGRYALTPAIFYEIRCSGDALEGQQTGRKSEPLRAEAPDVLFVPGQPRYRYVILRGEDGRITGFAQRREAWDLVWTRKPD